MHLQHAELAVQYADSAPLSTQRAFPAHTRHGHIHKENPQQDIQVCAMLVQFIHVCIYLCSMSLLYVCKPIANEVSGHTYKFALLDCVQHVDRNR